MFNLFKWKKKESRPKTVDLAILPYGKTALAPVISENALKLHYDKIAKIHTMNYNSGFGDIEFEYDVVKLHNMFFSQFNKSNNNNLPSGPSLKFIIDHFGTFQQFKELVAATASQIKGSDWVYVSISGVIGVLNNNWRNDIVMVFDCWEHAYMIDYGTDRRKYIESLWRIISWNYINDIITCNVTKTNYAINNQPVIIR